jgi:cell division protein FtsQ
MWDNPRVLNLAAGTLVGVALLALSGAALFLLWRSALFPIREIEVTTALKQTTRDDIQNAARRHVDGNFFAVSPDALRIGLERLPWVRRASVRRVWPDRLQVELEEHVALARWGDDALVNTYGERFQGSADRAEAARAPATASLPLFIGPAGTERDIAVRYARFAAVLAPLGAPLERVVLTQRFAWQLRLAGGLDVMLGRDADRAEERLRRFVGVYDVTLRKIPRRHEYVDLRYSNGFALRLPELRGARS